VGAPLPKVSLAITWNGFVTMISGGGVTGFELMGWVWTIVAPRGKFDEPSGDFGIGHGDARVAPAVDGTVVPL
jgi:hypothetical protein